MVVLLYSTCNKSREMDHEKVPLKVVFFWLTKLTPHPRIERGGQGSLRGGTLLLAGLGRGRPLLGRHTPGYWGLVTHVGAARGRYAAHTVGPGAAR